MKKIGDYKRLRCTDSPSIKLQNRNVAMMELHYDLTAILSNYNTRFLNLGCRNVQFNFARKSIKRVERKSTERSLYTNSQSTFRTRICRFLSLEDIELSSHKRVEISVLSHSRLKRLSLLNIGSIDHGGRLELKSLKKLTIGNSAISFSAFKSFMKLKNLVELELVKITFRSKVSKDRIFRTLKRAKGLKSIFIEHCDWDEDIYYPIAKSLNLNRFHFRTAERLVSFNMVVSGPYSTTFFNFDPRFYDYNYKDVRSLACFDKFVDVSNLERLNIRDLEEFSTKNVKIDKKLLEGFLLRFGNIRKISLVGCYIDSVLLYNLLRMCGKSLKYLNVTGVVVPFDFLCMCKRLLHGCQVVFGSESSRVEINQQ